jgi:hypothetical protein
MHEHDRANGIGGKGDGTELRRIQTSFNLRAEKLGWGLQTAVRVLGQPGGQKKRCDGSAVCR